MKCKNDLSFTSDEKNTFISHTLCLIKQYMRDKTFDYILIPDTTNKCFKEIIHSLNYPTLILKKRTKEDILIMLNTQSMMKAERVKLVSNIENMNQIQINLISANQRKRVANLLFETLPSIEGKDILYLDDSIFTGSTFKAISQQFKIKHSLVLFSNK